MKFHLSLFIIIDLLYSSTIFLIQLNNLNGNNLLIQHVKQIFIPINNFYMLHVTHVCNDCQV